MVSSVTSPEVAKSLLPPRSMDAKTGTLSSRYVTLPRLFKPLLLGLLPSSLMRILLFLPFNPAVW
jgi:hypothetical protein